jgi:hypothetical protein
MRLRRMIVFVTAFLMVATLLPTSASADEFRLRVEDVATGMGVVVSADPGSPFIFNQFDIVDPLNNVTTASMTVGMIAPASNPVAPELAKMSMQEITVHSTGAATLRLTLEDRFYGDVGNLQVNSTVFDGTWAPAFPGAVATGAGSSVVITSWANASNEVPQLGEDQLTAVVLPDVPAFTGRSTSQTFYSADSVTFGGSSYTPFLAGGPYYSLFTVVTITFTGAGSLAFQHDTTTTTSLELEPPPGDPTPEPGSLLLIASGVIGLASRMRRRKTRG